MKRNRIKGHYVTRRKDGTFKNWTSVGKSLKRDKKTKAKAVKKGYGHKRDVKKKRNIPLGKEKVKNYLRT